MIVHSIIHSNTIYFFSRFTKSLFERGGKKRKKGKKKEKQKMKKKRAREPKKGVKKKRRKQKEGGSMSKTRSKIIQRSCWRGKHPPEESVEAIEIAVKLP